MSQTNKITIEVTDAELEIIQDLRKMFYGRITIFVQDGKAFRKEVTEYKKLTKEGKFSPDREQQNKPKGVET